MIYQYIIADIINNRLFVVDNTLADLVLVVYKKNITSSHKILCTILLKHFVFLKICLCANVLYLSLI